MSKKKILLAEPVIPKKETIALTKKVLDDNFPNEGKFTKLFENKLSKLLNVRYVVTSTSGTISIFLALKAVGIKKGDEIIIPNLTFPATANAVMLAGGKPVLVDVDEKNLLINEINLLQKITKKTKAIIPVHISGRGSNINKILKIAKYNKYLLLKMLQKLLCQKLMENIWVHLVILDVFLLHQTKLLQLAKVAL